MDVVVFTTNSVRIIPADQAPKELIKWPNVVINPDLSKVQGLLPQFWKLDNGEVVPMTPKEIRYRKRHIEVNGMDNAIRYLPLSEIEPPIKEYEVIRALESEYNQLKTINYVYLGLQIACALLLLAILIKK